METYYPMMFKRKSFRQFKSKVPLKENTLKKIVHFLDHEAERLDPNRPFCYQLLPVSETTCKRGEYCVVVYSPHDNLSLLNVGYVLEQLDFFLCAHSIGVCWYGMGKLSKGDKKGAPFTIMMAIGNAEHESFRKDYRKAKRKSLSELVMGAFDPDFIDYVKYAPSACNAQPWYLVRVQNGFFIEMRSKEKLLIPKEKIGFYNTIDLGIMIYACELWLKAHGVPYRRHLTKQQAPLKTGDPVVYFETT